MLNGDMILIQKLFKMTRTVNTVSAYRSLLQEEDYEIKEIGVRKLLANINLHWIDIANDITLIEELHQDDNFPDRPLVAFLLAKLYFYLNDYDGALSYALQSGPNFNIKNSQDEFHEILVNKCIEKYIKCCQQKDQISQDYQQYKTVVDYVIDNAFNTNQFKLPLGIALDTQDVALFERVSSATQFNELVESILPHLLGLDIAFRSKILGSLTTKIPKHFASPIQYLNLLQILQINGDFSTVSKIIYDCVKNGERQIAFTLALEVSQIHGFNRKVLASIPTEPEFSNERKILEDIIEGNFADEIHNIVLKSHARTDPHYLQVLKKIEAKNSISHGAAILSLSMLQAFTQDDSFFQVKENFEWASKCTHWNKFSSIASLGLIYRNHKNKEVFKKYLPEGNAADGVNHYSNGGALYGLGLLFTGTCNQEIIDYIIGVTTNPTHNANEVVMHGACLGLGLTAFASGNQHIGERLKDILNSSTSVMGEASALALGLTFAGTNSEAIISDLIAIASDTEHDKIIRSVCIAIGLISFQSPSLEFLENLQANDQLKLAVPFYLACAYFKTSNPVVVRKLLKLSNDISNDVKRSAVLALGFVMYHDQKLTNVIKMLLYSYNPFIRYGCIFALAIGSKDPKETIELIWPNLTDPVDFVRQGVFIALSILFQVSTVNSDPKLADFRKTIEEILAKAHGEIMVKMGAILSVGLLDFGGRNMTVSLTTRSGLPKIEAVAGLLIFTQYWNWFPYINFIGLAASPSTFIGVTSHLKIPKNFQLKSNCKPSMFDYPVNIKKQEKKKDDKKENAKELSTTNKVKARLLNKKKESQMELELPTNVIKKPSLISSVSVRETIIEHEKEEKVQQKKEEETFSILNNPTRISEKQKKLISFIEGRYMPLLGGRKIGISFLKDSQPLERDDYLNEKAQGNKMEIEKPLQNIPEQKKQEDDSLAPPEEFQYEDEEDKLIRDNNGK